MPLWGTAHASADNKPKFLSSDEDAVGAGGSRMNAYATNAGWVMQAGTAASGNDNASADPEILVAIGGLAGTSSTTGLRTPTVTALRYVVGTTATTDLTAADSTAGITVEVTWDEEVTVAGSPQIVVVNGNQSGGGFGNYTLVYTATGSTANRKRFTLTSQSLGNTDVLTTPAAIALNSGTISDTVVGGTTLAALLDISSVVAVHTVLS